jgi:hypothetical protein
MDKDVLVPLIEAIIEHGDPVPIDMIFSLVREGYDFSEIVKLIEEKE